MSTSAIVLADSISATGVRITTLELVMPRFILSQFNKHASIRSCAQSSRAIPMRKLIEKATYEPKVWGSNQGGMQPGKPILADLAVEAALRWGFAKKAAAEQALRLVELGVHKQWVNRLLEPFSYVKVVATATEWDLFFRLRLAHDAQDEMQELAESMRAAMDASTPKVVGMFEWHLPYARPDEDADVGPYKRPFVSAARCARTSYLAHTGERDLTKDIALSEQLVRDRHLTPLEMPATPSGDDDWFGPYHGWVSLRHVLAFQSSKMRRTQAWREVE